MVRQARDPTTPPDGRHVRTFFVLTEPNQRHYITFAHLASSNGQIIRLLLVAWTIQISLQHIQPFI